MTPQQRHQALRQIAETLPNIDEAVYHDNDRDPLDPVLGGGDPRCRICVFGRDPGRDEIRHGEPFIGKGGQLVRQVLHQRVHGEPMPDFAASQAIGRVAFWANTVPYKPVGNKAWSMKIRKEVQPIIADLLVHGWTGRDVFCLGQNAFLWFGIGQAREVRAELKAAWSAEPRFEGPPVQIELCAPDGGSRPLRIWPVPHPSPLNATWHRRFPTVLGDRLSSAGFDGDNWRLDGSEHSL